MNILLIFKSQSSPLPQNVPIHGTLTPYMWLDDHTSTGTELKQCSPNSHGHTSMHLTCNLDEETLNLRKLEIPALSVKS